MPDEQPNGFFNRASVVLFLLFVIPASLTLAGVYYVAIQGRVPGGVDTFCERSITETTELRIDTYDYTAGLVEFQTQAVSIRNDADADWTELFSDTIPIPRPLTCDSVLTRLDDDNLVLQNQKSVAWSNDNGVTWQVQNVCDDPRPSNRCDAEALNVIDVNFNIDGTGTITIIESAVDEFGEPQRDDNGNLIADDEWQLTTSDYGATWLLITDA